MLPPSVVHKALSLYIRENETTLAAAQENFGLGRMEEALVYMEKVHGALSGVDSGLLFTQAFVVELVCSEHSRMCASC